jgi:hypothetical protein
VIRFHCPKKREIQIVGVVKEIAFLLVDIVKDYLVLESKLCLFVLVINVMLRVSKLALAVQVITNACNVALVSLNKLECRFEANSLYPTVVVAASKNANLEEHLLGKRVTLHLVIRTFTQIVNVHFQTIALMVHFE